MGNFTITMNRDLCENFNDGVTNVSEPFLKKNTNSFVQILKGLFYKSMNGRVITNIFVGAGFAAGIASAVIFYGGVKGAQYFKETLKSKWISEALQEKDVLSDSKKQSAGEHGNIEGKTSDKQ